jgi:ABC-type multidrug transport system fused ATPase/permease subunit
MTRFLNSKFPPKPYIFAKILNDSSRLPGTPHLAPPPPSWPQSGGVVFESVTVQYKTGGVQPALDNVSFALGSGQHLGIVGRTGKPSTRRL